MKMLRLTIILIALLSAILVTSGSQQMASAINTPFTGVNWPDCTTDSEEFCVEKLEFTPAGSSTAQTISDAVPAMGTTPAQHPNTSVLVYLNSVNNNLYGKMGLAALNFEFSDPAFETLVGGGTKTKTGIPAGKYQLVVRTGTLKPHSMTIKGKPAGDNPFAVTQGADGYYTLTLSATSEPFITIMDSTKWDACRAVKWDGTCEPDTAFLRKLSGIVTAIPSTYQEVEEVRAPGMPSVSPSLSLSQGLWVASNTVVIDVKPEMNLVTKSLGLPAYGPHYVPTDFPSAGLTAEGNRYLNPAYFTAFIPNELLAFVNNFQMAEIAEKAPGRISATIEDSSAKAVPQAHETTMTGSGALIKVAITHYSAPNPKIYFGGTTSSTGTTTTTSTPGPVAVAPSITSQKALTARAIASYKKFVIPAGAQISISVAASSKKYCKAVGATVKYVSAGTCKITVTAKPKKGSAKSTTVTLKVKK
ncbi:MAG: hypothetical protein EBY23_08365 [Actinobacteria bacterium]|nr:hypothetical protein [Actinomycetota bacterium]